MPCFRSVSVAVDIYFLVSEMPCKASRTYLYDLYIAMG
jgi:hypothetical protein